MCISCYKPETTHGMIVWATSTGWRVLNVGRVPMEAKGTAEEIYSDHEATPQQRNLTIVRLCQSCAKKTGVPVHNINEIHEGAELRAVIQPEDM